MSDKRGYKVQGNFYPYVPVEDWFNQDFVLVRELARMPVGDVFAGKCDLVTLKMALAGVAVSHRQSELGVDQLIEALYRVKPDQIEEIGFEELEGEASPPEDAAAETPVSGSSSSSETKSDANPESTQSNASGEPGSDTGSPESTPGT